MRISTDIKAVLAKRGVTTLHEGPFDLPDKTILEAPCSLKWMKAEYFLEMGAFSYAVSGYYFGVKIGRYTSIGEEVQIGRGSHPGVGAYAVVTKDVPPYTVVVGNPASIVKLRFPPKTIVRMQAIAWWRYAFWDLPGAPVADPEAFLDHVEAAIQRGIAPYTPEKLTLSALPDL